MSAVKRGPNWTNEEDESLCEAWLNCSQDSIVGIHQKTEKLYQRVFESFVVLCKQKGLGNNPELRAPSGVKARWHVISKACSKFAGNLAQVNNRQRSGASLQDNFNEALSLYKNDTNTTFSFAGSFRILQNAPKWQTYESHLKNKTSNMHQSGSKRKLLEDDDTEGYDDCAPSTSCAPMRPLGIKSSKAAMETSGNLTKCSMELAAAAKQVASAAVEKTKLARERIAAINRLTDAKIMTTDLGTLSETARAYIEMQQKAIFEKLQNEASNDHFDPEDYIICDENVEEVLSDKDDFSDEAAEDGAEDQPL